MGKMSQDWLSRLAPPHAPHPAGWWPPAPGWWVLALILLASVAAFFHWRSKTRLRRIALREIRKLKSCDDIALAKGLENLLRRYAIARYGGDRVAMLSGERWIDFVIEHGGSAWSKEAGASLLCIAYGGISRAHRTSWIAGAEGFIKERR